MVFLTAKAMQSFFLVLESFRNDHAMAGFFLAINHSAKWEELVHILGAYEIEC